MTKDRTVQEKDPVRPYRTIETAEDYLELHATSVLEGENKARYARRDQIFHIHKVMDSPQWLSEVYGPGGPRHQPAVAPTVDLWMSDMIPQLSDKYRINLRKTAEVVRVLQKEWPDDRDDKVGKLTYKIAYSVYVLMNLYPFLAKENGEQTVIAIYREALRIASKSGTAMAKETIAQAEETVRRTDETFEKITGADQDHGSITGDTSPILVEPEPREQDDQDQEGSIMHDTSPTVVTPTASNVEEAIVAVTGARTAGPATGGPGQGRGKGGGRPRADAQVKFLRLLDEALGYARKNGVPETVIKSAFQEILDNL